MLKKILSRETCANCRFCCSFRRESLWETPLFDKELVSKDEFSSYRFDEEVKVLYSCESGKEEVLLHMQKDRTNKEVSSLDISYKCYRMHLDDSYISDDPNEEVPCYFLDQDKGCVLKGDDKPFDCSIWPLRLMRKEGKLVIALTPTCPATNKLSQEELRNFVSEGIGDKIYHYGVEHPYIIKDYREGFPVLMSFD